MCWSLVNTWNSKANRSKNVNSEESGEGSAQFFQTTTESSVWSQSDLNPPILLALTGKEPPLTSSRMNTSGEHIRQLKPIQSLGTQSIDLSGSFVSN